jgi:hypothetical protein
VKQKFVKPKFFKKMKKVISVMAASMLFVTLYAHGINTDRTTGKPGDSSPNKMEKKEMRKKLRDERKLEVSNLSLRHFDEDFGAVNHVVWRRTKNFDEASFVMDGKKTTAYYDWNGVLVGTTSPVKFKDIPAKAQEYINEHYPNYKKEAVIYFDDNELNSTDMYLYDTPFDDEDNYFVELTDGKQLIILKSDVDGYVSLFRTIDK